MDISNNDDVAATGMSEENSGKLEDQKMAVPIIAPTVEVNREVSLKEKAQRPVGGVMRTCRDSRGSIAKDRIRKMPPCAAGKRSSIHQVSLNELATRVQVE